MNNYVVYVHINRTNGKRYYGITSIKPEQRWKNGRGYKAQHFARAIDKYSWDGFDHIIIARNLTEDEAKWLEVEMIAAHNTTDKRYGYNMTSGGDGCSKPCSEETKAKIRLGNKYNPDLSKPVICITTNKLFYSIKGAQTYYNTGHHIQECCKGTRKSCGKFNGQPLKWKFINYKHNKTYRVA